MCTVITFSDCDEMKGYEYWTEDEEDARSASGRLRRPTTCSTTPAQNGSFLKDAGLMAVRWGIPTAIGLAAISLGYYAYQESVARSNAERQALLELITKMVEQSESRMEQLTGAVVHMIGSMDARMEKMLEASDRRMDKVMSAMDNRMTSMERMVRGVTRLLGSMDVRMSKLMSAVELQASNLVQMFPSLIETPTGRNIEPPAKWTTVERVPSQKTTTAVTTTGSFMSTLWSLTVESLIAGITAGTKYCFRVFSGRCSLTGLKNH